VARDTGIPHRAPHQPLASSWTCRPHPDALIISDAAVNIAPQARGKGRYRAERDRPRARAMGVADVRVGHPERHGARSIPRCRPRSKGGPRSCKMADRGQITGAVLDGPLALDNAISLDAAAIKPPSSLAGRRPGQRADRCPDPRSGANMAGQEPVLFSPAPMPPAIVLGARVPHHPDQPG